MREPVGLLLVGCGRISGAHVAALAGQEKQIRLVGVVDSDAETAGRMAAFHGVAGFVDLAEGLAAPGVDAVLIASPNSLHAAQAAMALAAGKHVLVEKPLAETGAQARELAATAERRGLVLAAGHTYRHNAAVSKLVDMMPQWGRLRAVEVSSCVFWDGPQAPWWATRQPEEGLIISLFAPHSLDFVQLVMGADDPLRVQVEAARWQPGWQGEDEAMILLGYPGRRMASVHISYNQASVFDRKVLHFAGGVAEIEDGEVLKWNGEVLVAPPEGVLANPRAMGGRKLGHFFAQQLLGFAAAVRGEEHRLPTGHDAARLIDLIDRVKAAARRTCADAIDPDFAA
ncbi:Gfo/Idh/MocA family protein [Novosphingobium taihuense]|uniref:Putative dehydrogenase n=1 Tax=Novosphingobium taihuense TaxID=260085 RepID=A0A7W7AD31_9SPHN|nr:Gfo/Idh/MocA family oxidoreductase [Novosphingobium taihuense]MBB4614818.1 putative dehydrogenase [Novosphingobium taihuense]TWH84740.1 putative dehydrogenase [Novosphingobium taihuense]